MTSANSEKLQAARTGAALVRNGMFVGLGSGSTSILAVRALAARLKEKSMRVEAVASSAQTEAVARECGIPMQEFGGERVFDIYLDGADQIDPTGGMIKGGGGALFREKMLALRSRQVVIMVDSSKPVPVLGHGFPLPVDVVPFGAAVTVRRIAKALGCNVSLRRSADGSLFRTCDGNHVADCRFENGIADPKATETILRSITGVVETGLFLGICDVLLIGRGDTVEESYFKLKATPDE